MTRRRINQSQDGTSPRGDVPTPVLETVTMTTPKLLPLADAADALGVAPSTLRHQLRNRKIRGVKRGRDWFVRTDEVERYRSESQAPRASRTAAKVDVLDAAIAGCVDVIVAEIDRRCVDLKGLADLARTRRDASALQDREARHDALQDLRAWVVDEVVER